MPILKPISGHGSTSGIRRYLEKGGRALARDFFNLSWDERKDVGASEELKAAVMWDVEMGPAGGSGMTSRGGGALPGPSSTSSCRLIPRTPSTSTP